MGDEPPGVLAHRVDDGTEQPGGRHRAARHRGDQVTEQPGPTETASADHDTVAPGARHHRDRVGRLPDVAVAEHRDAVDGLFQLTDRVPSRVAGVVLFDRAGVQRDPCDAFLGADQTGRDVGPKVVPEPHAELRGDRHAVGAGGADRGPQDAPEQRRFGRYGRSPALAGDLGGRTAEVEVDVVDETFVAHHVHGPPEHLGVAAVDLEAPGGLVGPELHHLAGLVVAVHDRSRHDHLVDVDEAGPGVATHRTERGVGDARHRRQHDRCRRREVSDPQVRHGLPRYLARPRDHPSSAGRLPSDHLDAKHREAGSDRRKLGVRRVGVDAAESVPLSVPAPVMVMVSFMMGSFRSV